MNDETLYLKATTEFESGAMDAALWAKALAQCKGNENEAKYKYIELRVVQFQVNPDLFTSKVAEEVIPDNISESSVGIEEEEIIKEATPRKPPVYDKTGSDSKAEEKSKINIISKIDFFLSQFVEIKERYKKLMRGEYSFRITHSVFGTLAWILLLSLSSVIGEVQRQIPEYELVPALIFGLVMLYVASIAVGNWNLLKKQALTKRQVHALSFTLLFFAVFVIILILTFVDIIF
jgi:hypothetical protein